MSESRRVLEGAVTEVKRALSDHEDRDEILFGKVSETLAVIKENHLSHIEADMVWIKWGIMLAIAGIAADFFR